MGEKCLVKGCRNHKHEGHFVGDLCAPCYQMLHDGYVGPSEAWFAERIISMANALEEISFTAWDASNG